MLVMSNWKKWFPRPRALHQIVSRLLLNISGVSLSTASTCCVSWGSPGILREHHQSGENGRLPFHPQPYVQILMHLGWGVFFKDPSWPGMALAFANSAALVATARAEESEMLHKFGEDYVAYMREIRMSLPFVA